VEFGVEIGEYRGVV
jgi:hypothetical protein